MEQLPHCIICGSEKLSTFLECKDHFITGEKFKLSSCGECGFCFTNPRPDPGEAPRYYESEKYISHSKTEKGLINRLFHLARKITIHSKKRLVRKYSVNDSILDYGCGTGEFLNAMQSSGFRCTGIEPNQAARETAINSYGLNVINEDQLGDLDNNSFGSITLWHVLEHVYPLKDRLEQFYTKLSTDGTLIVALPNMDSFDARHYRSYWAAYDVPRHIYHFTPKTIIKLMGDHGFDHIKTKSMILDAFYISLLSEKYKHGKPKFFRALFTGSRSNISAFSGKRNYSSLIYIFKKSI